VEKGLLFWILMLLYLLFSGWMGWGPNGDRRWFGFGVIGFLLFLVLGWAVFGQPLK
jgi:hypothetical protein